MKIFSQKKIGITTLALGIMIFAAFAFRPPEHGHEHHKSNLKVLPKDISHQDLMTIMHSYKKALNYRCGDCHAPSTTNPQKLDFSSYANPKKKVALKMMKMVEKINRKNFGIKGSFAENYTHHIYKVTCYTCHHGSEHPAIEALKKAGK